MIDLQYLIALFHAGLPVWIVTVAGLVCLLTDALWPKKGAGAVFALALLGLAAALWFGFRQWLAGEDVTQDLFVRDRVTLFFVVLVLFIGFVHLLNTWSYLSLFKKNSGGGSPAGGRSPAGEMATLTLFAVVGMIFLFASDHLIVNFIGLETMSLAVYVMVGSNRKDARSNEAAMKYYVMGSVASALLLYGIVLLYWPAKTFRLTELSQVALFPEQVFLARIAAVLILSGFLFKLALVPFHFWAPDVYEGAPTPVTGFMATGVKVAAFALFIRVLTALNYLPMEVVSRILEVCVVLTLLVGNLAAIVQDNVKRMLAYSSISHAGYLLLGLLVGFQSGKFDPLVSSAVLFYLAAYSLMTLGAFAVLSVMVEERKEATQFSDLTGLGASRPVLAAAFSLFMISLLGIPLTAGFTAKYGIFSFAVKNGFRRPVKTEEVPFPLMFSLVFCAVGVVVLGVVPMWYLDMAQKAAGAFK
ncbi:MAG: NADH-quinone oxidoreductase subunit N [Deltaproteobacteria bacterium]|nr:NADH-quinone oxidoreductase subunit N [Deltaproteobacteria bacterium]